MYTYIIYLHGTYAYYLLRWHNADIWKMFHVVPSRNFSVCCSLKIMCTVVPTRCDVVPISTLSKTDLIPSIQIKLFPRDICRSPKLLHLYIVHSKYSVFPQNVMYYSLYIIIWSCSLKILCRSPKLHVLHLYVVHSGHSVVSSKHNVYNSLYSVYTLYMKLFTQDIMSFPQVIAIVVHSRYSVVPSKHNLIFPMKLLPQDIVSFSQDDRIHVIPSRYCVVPTRYEFIPTS